MKALGICRWCQQNTSLIRAHIIPKAFYVPIKGISDRVVILRPTEQKFTQFSSSGIFDSGILCSKCDAFLGRLDEYGLQIFKSPPSEADRVTQGGLSGYNLKCDDVQRAKKFLLSVLWRASVSSQDFFKTVSLGQKYEDKIRQLITSGAQINEADFEFIVIRAFDHPYDGGIVPPFRVQFEGVTAQQLYLPYFKFIIRVDQRRFPSVASMVQFRPNSILQCLRLSYKDSIEEKIISSVTERTLAKQLGKS
ncbi:MAG TPA: hypothetical protein VMI53_13905 [Opitutaceae bacterium]|nr:hypothetical protein [Opitutaceae bacterium]